MMSNGPSEQTLSLSPGGGAVLACLREGEEMRPNVRAFSSEVWQDALAFAAAQRVSALLYRRLLADDLKPHVPAPVLGHLADASRRVAVRNLRFQGDLQAIVLSLAAEGIPVLVLKGAHLAPAYYGDLSVREMIDIDILVRPVDQEAVVACARVAGYVQRGSAVIEQNGSVGKHLPCLIRPGVGGLEIHSNIAGLEDPHEFDLGDLWHRSVPLRFGAASARALCAADLVLHLCLHVAYQHRFGFSLRGLCDITRVISAEADQLDWATIVARSTAWKSRRGTFLTLKLASDLMGAAVPSGVLECLAPGDTDDHALALAHAELMATAFPQYVLSPQIAELAAHGGRARLRHAWRRVFAPRMHIEHTYGLRRGSRRVGLYYARRIIDLLRRHWRVGVGLVVTRGDDLVAAARRRNEIGLWLRR